jgi:hypothetical protein
MIEAGKRAVLGELGGAVSSHWNPDVLAKEIFLAAQMTLPHDDAAKGRPIRRVGHAAPF